MPFGPNRYASTVPYGRAFVMVGGSKAYLDAVLKYDPDQDNWEEMEVTLSVPRAGVAAMISQVVNQTVNITAAATGPAATNQRVVTRSGHFGRRNIKSQVRRFRMETKAAKTLGIIVGCFICCWFPFFTIYLIQAFCSDCGIPELIFSIFFWLGYCNSALNPFIYALLFIHS